MSQKKKGAVAVAAAPTIKGGKHMLIKGISLLSEKEFRKHTDILTNQVNSWWVKPENNWKDTEFMPAMSSDGHTYDYPVTNLLGVVPVLFCDLSECNRGSKVKFADHIWTVISNNMMVCDEAICRHVYSEEDDEAGFDNSSVKRYLDTWLSYHKAESMFLMKYIIKHAI